MKEKNTTGTMKTITLITGILTALLGVYTIIRPLQTFLSIGWILGTLLFINGIELVIVSVLKEKKDIGACLLGVLEGLAGLILLFSGFQRILTDVTAAYLVGGSILIYGIFQIMSGTKGYQQSKGRGVLGIICGILSVLISVVSFTHPVLTMISVGYIIACSIFMQGINMIVLALNMGKAVDK